jgi:hypothetical protein
MVITLVTITSYICVVSNCQCLNRAVHELVEKLIRKQGKKLNCIDRFVIVVFPKKLTSAVKHENH